MALAPLLFGRPTGIATLAVLLCASGCCCSGGSPIEFCDRETFESHCEGNVAVSCPADKMFPSTVRRTICPSACTSVGGMAGCTLVPLTECESLTECTENRESEIWCIELGEAIYRSSIQPCAVGDVCVDGLGCSEPEP